MLPSVASLETARKILALQRGGGGGQPPSGRLPTWGMYLGAATVLGVGFISWRPLVMDGSSAVAMRLFACSITYITLLSWSDGGRRPDRVTSTMTTRPLRVFDRLRTAL